MSEIFANLQSAAWWFSAVIVALAINLLSAYLKPTTDEWLGRYSERRRVRLMARKHAFANEVEITAASSERTAQVVESEMRNRNRALVFLQFSVLAGLQFVVLRMSSGTFPGATIRFALELLMLVIAMGAIVMSWRAWSKVVKLTPLAQAARDLRVKNAASAK